MSTLRDVAAKANVSVITASRVINYPYLVKTATRERVMKAIEELHYMPNITAKNLVTRKSGTVVIYIPADYDFSDPFVMNLITGVSISLSEHMYSLLILRDLETEHFCDGYIVTGMSGRDVAPVYEYAVKRGRHVVMFGHTYFKGISCIDVDNIAGGKIAVKYLLNNGHRKIAMINADEAGDYPSERYRGYVEALSEYGIDPDSSLYITSKNHVPEGEEAAKKLLKEKKCTAIFCATDALANGAIQAAKSLGMKVPNDISIMGYDGMGYQYLSSPTLSTVKQPVTLIGEMLSDKLLDEINGDTKFEQKLLIPKLSAGGSVAPAQKR